MRRSKRLTAVIAVTTVVLFAGQAYAGWGYGSSGGGWGSSGGSSGGWSRGSSGGSWGSSGGSSGHYRRGLFARIHDRWHSHRSHGSWGSSGGSWGSSGGHAVVRYHGSSGGSSGGGSNGGSSTIYRVAPESESPPAEGGEAPLPAPGGNTQYRASHALLAVDVPTDAKVFVNGVATTSTGAHRQFVSRNLNHGFDYTYEVRAEITRNGRKIEETKTVMLRAGENTEIAFDLESRPETSLTVYVPHSAKVVLAGHETKTIGGVRTFTTTTLDDGAEWENYTVMVEYQQDGRTLTQEKTITLRAGESRTLDFQLDGAKVGNAR